MLFTQKQYLTTKFVRKQQEWFVNVVINQRIGKDTFVAELSDQMNNEILALFHRNSDITTEMSRYLINQLENNKFVKAKERLELLKYQLMTEDVFQEFLSLFKETGSDVHQRQRNYVLLFQCALATDEQSVKKVLQWIEKRFTNESLMILENFLQTISDSSYLFHHEILSDNFQSIEHMFNLAINHLQRTTNTLQIIVNYGIKLLQSIEFHLNKKLKDDIQTFAKNIIKT